MMALNMEIEAWEGGSQCSRRKLTATETAKLSLGEDTDKDDGPFASDVEADPEEDEAVIDDESTIPTLASHYQVDS